MGAPAVFLAWEFLDALKIPPMGSFITSTEVAERLGCSVSHVRNLRERGELPYYRAPGSPAVRYDEADVDRLLASWRREATTGPLAEAVGQ